jgi:hypothetical protein
MRESTSVMIAACWACNALMARATSRQFVDELLVVECPGVGQRGADRREGVFGESGHTPSIEHLFDKHNHLGTFHPFSDFRKLS